MLQINDETPEESAAPISVEEFERRHPAMLQAIAQGVRQELTASLRLHFHRIARPALLGLCLSAIIITLSRSSK